MSTSRPHDERVYRATAAPPATAKNPAAASSRESRPLEGQSESWVDLTPAKFVQALIFGAIFGFLLQKGGVAHFDILIGVLLLENFVVVQVMLSAIIVGMVGAYVLNRLGVLELKIKETVFGSNILGGLIFGVGFGLLAYCPGTDAAAVGQGNLDALVGVLGMIGGSYLFALSSKFSKGTITKWGNRGKITLPELVGVSTPVFIALAVPLLVGILVAIEYLL
jgi:uncharacterized protein